MENERKQAAIEKAMSEDEILKDPANDNWEYGYLCGFKKGISAGYDAAKAETCRTWMVVEGETDVHYTECEPDGGYLIDEDAKP